jgi:hypothetical protein
MTWFDPATRYFPPGIIDPNYQGLPAVIVDPVTWRWKPYNVPVQPAGMNSWSYQCALQLGDQNHFSTKAELSGYPEYELRSSYFALEPKEQSRLLRESAGRWVTGASIETASVENATNPWNKLTWTIDGSWEPEEISYRAIQPFPGIQPPFPKPSSWPERRKQLIVLPYCSTTTATSEIRIPSTWKVAQIPTMDHENEFGRVRWGMNLAEEKEGTVIQVAYSIQVQRLSAPATSYEALKQFLAWIDEGCRRTIRIECEPGASK